nr:hypothetical protein [Eubacterium sp.]
MDNKRDSKKAKYYAFKWGSFVVALVLCAIGLILINSGQSFSFVISVVIASAIIMGYLSATFNDIHALRVFIIIYVLALIFKPEYAFAVTGYIPTVVLSYRFVWRGGYNTLKRTVVSYIWMTLANFVCCFLVMEFLYIQIDFVSMSVVVFRSFTFSIVVSFIISAMLYLLHRLSNESFIRFLLKYNSRSSLYLESVRRRRLNRASSKEKFRHPIRYYYGSQLSAKITIILVVVVLVVGVVAVAGMNVAIFQDYDVNIDWRRLAILDGRIFFIVLDAALPAIIFSDYYAQKHIALPILRMD